MITPRITHLLAASLLLALTTSACGDDDSPPNTDTGTGEHDTTADAGTDAGEDTASDAATEDAEPDVAVEPGVTFVLENANPGGLARYVQIVDNRGAPAWFNLMPVGSLDAYLRAHSNCTLCSCDEPECTPCEPEPQILKLEAGEEVSARWNGTLIEINANPVCENAVAPDTEQLQVEFAWSPEPPDQDGQLPASVISRTRVRFNANTDTEVRYRIEASE